MGDIKRILALFHSIVGKELDVNQYGQRLLLQKLAYVLYKIDKTLDYMHGWYVRGPYSRFLAHDAFIHCGKLQKGNIDDYKPTEGDEKLKQNFELIFPQININELELVASILYLNEEFNISIDDAEKMFGWINTLKPWYTKEDVTKALEKIKKFGELLNVREVNRLA